MTTTPTMTTDIFGLSEKARTGLLVLSAQTNTTPAMAITRIVEEAAKDDFSFLVSILSTNANPKKPAA